MIEILKAIILGIVEGITEWLPISSTGHMILVEEFIQLDTTAAFKEMFFVVIPVRSKNTLKMFNCNSNVNPEKPATTNESMARSVTTVPNALENDTPS